jgi:glycosyltransferase involved in cell wall biosynthesis
MTSVADNGITIVNSSFLHPALFRPVLGLEGALRLARRYNGYRLRRLVSELRIERLLIANTWFDVPRLGQSVPIYYDVGDWFNEDTLPPAYLAREKAWFRSSFARATRTFAVSLPLVQKLAKEYEVQSSYLPNGVDVNAIRGVGKSVVEDLRRRLSLENRWVLGYIGNHDEHAGLDFLLKVFDALRQRVPDAALLIVGPYDRWKGRLIVPPSMPVRFTGPLLPAEIPAFCQLQDVSVHPCEKSQFRDYAFPLKVIEATAARKFVVSTDLLSLRTLGFPSLHLLERSVEHWVGALESIRSKTWDSEWDHLVAPFDWEHLAEKAAAWME